MSDTLKNIEKCFSPYLTPEEAITYLRLDADKRNPVERLRNLIRRQGLPVIRRGRLQLFRKTAIDDWLDNKKPITINAGRARARQNHQPFGGSKI